MDGRPLTALYWSKRTPFLRFTASDTDGSPPSAQLDLGSRISWRVHPRRTCVGMRGLSCPQGSASIPTDRPSAQCPFCEANDPGKRLARGHDLDDPREFALYLAYFGPGLLKVGLTAVARGDDRLVEQGALAYTWLASGPLRAVRAAELAVSAAKIATERLRHKAKARGRWTAPYAPGTELPAAAARVERLLDGLGVTRKPCQVTDLRGVYGLDAVARPDDQVADIPAEARLSGTLTALVGRDAYVDTGAAAPLLVDVRLLAGRVLEIDAPGAPAVAGLSLAPVDADRMAGQDTLF